MPLWVHLLEKVAVFEDCDFFFFVGGRGARYLLQAGGVKPLPRKFWVEQQADKSLISHKFTFKNGKVTRPNVYFLLVKDFLLYLTLYTSAIGYDKIKRRVLKADLPEGIFVFQVFYGFLQIFCIKNLQIKKFALPLHSQYSNGGFI